MRRPKIVIIVLIGLLAIGGGLGFYLFGNGGRGVQFRTAAAERTDISSTISATGTLNAVISVQVGSQVSGTIKYLYADFNTVVKRGQLIARIDPDTFEAKVAQAKADLENARATVLNQRAAIARAGADLATAKANVVRSDVALRDAKIKYDSRVALFREGGISQEERDSAQATYDSAQAQLEASRASLNAAQAQLEVAQAQLAAAEAQVRLKQAVLDQAQVDLDHTFIRAPVDGTVISRNVDVGQTVAASLQAPTLFVIAQDLTKMQVDSNVDESDIGRVVLDQTATFTVDSYPGQTFRGMVSQIRQAPIIVQNVVTYDAVILVDNAGLKLVPGMTANVKILVVQKRDVLAVPNAAFRIRLDEAAPGGRDAAGGKPARGGGEGKQRVYVLKDGRPAERSVRTGISDGQRTEVLEGLGEGEAVVVAVTQRGRPGGSRPGGPGARF